MINKLKCGKSFCLTHFTLSMGGKKPATTTVYFWVWKRILKLEKELASIGQDWATEHTHTHEL